MSASPDSPDTCNDLLKLSLIIGELAAELLYHGMNVVELGRVAGGDRKASHGSLELSVVEAVHSECSKLRKCSALATFGVSLERETVLDSRQRWFVAMVAILMWRSLLRLQAL